MASRTIGLVVVAAVVVGGLIVASPALRAKFSQRYNQVTGWDEEARRADPVGFLVHVEAKLAQDLTTMQKTRRELAAEVGTLVRKAREQSALGEQARTLAEEFRTEYQAALSNDHFPIEVRGEAYTEDQTRSQVSLLLAQADGYEQSLAEIDTVRSDAEERMEQLAVRIERTEAQQAMLATKRELLRVRELTAEGETLLAQVDELMTGNTQAIADNPVRTVRELVEAEVKPTNRAGAQQVERFLAAEPTIEASPVSHTPSLDIEQAAPVPKKKQRREKREKPIFQQS